jgi:hypothetical protein
MSSCRGIAKLFVSAVGLWHAHPDTGLLFLAALVLHLAVSVLWVLALIVLFVCDVITGFVRGVRFV